MAFLIVGGSDLVYRNSRGKTVILRQLPISVQTSGLDVNWRQSLEKNAKHTILVRNMFLCSTNKFCHMDRLFGLTLRSHAKSDLHGSKVKVNHKLKITIIAITLAVFIVEG